MLLLLGQAHTHIALAFAVRRQNGARLGARADDKGLVNLGRGWGQ